MKREHSAYIAQILLDVIRPPTANTCVKVSVPSLHDTICSLVLIRKTIGNTRTSLNLEELEQFVIETLNANSGLNRWIREMLEPDPEKGYERLKGFLWLASRSFFFW